MLSKSRKLRGKPTDFLLRLLSHGPLPARTVKAGAEQMGFSWRTIQRAEKSIGVVAIRTGGIASSGQWIWALPNNVSLAAMRQKPCEQMDSAKDDKFNQQLELDLG